MPRLWGSVPTAPSAVQTVAVFGAAAVLIAPPSEACHFKRCKIEPPFAAVLVSTNASLLPSNDMTGEVATVPVVAAPAALKFVLYDQ